LEKISKIEEIKLLKTLLDQGAITIEEFNQLKKNVLEKEEVESIHNPKNGSPFSDIPKAYLNPNISDVKTKFSGDYNYKNNNTNFLTSTFAKVALAIGITILIGYYIGSSNSLSKKQFKTLDDLTSAFQGKNYDDVKATLGEPYFKYLNVERREITYRWHGVGVIGRPDAVIIFDAFEFSGSYSCRNFNSVYFSEKDWDGLKGNDDVFNID